MTLLHCIECEKEFSVAAYRKDEAHACSRKCHLSWLAKKQENHSFINCLVCGKLVKQWPCRKRFTCSRECSGKYGNRFKKGQSSYNKGKKGFIPWNKGIKVESITGEKNGFWKGNNVGYQGLHEWISKKLGTPMKCSYCKSTEKSRYNWASINHSYTRNLNEWIRLCVKCHRQYDMGKIKL